MTTTMHYEEQHSNSLQNSAFFYIFTAVLQKNPLEKQRAAD